MDLWSKGLGKRVLSLNLQEYEGVEKCDEGIIIKGVMGAPVFWEYKVTMTEADFVDFFSLLTKGNGAVDFIIHSPNRWKIYYRVVKNVTTFLLLSALAVVKMVLPGKKQVSNPQEQPSK
ncbi:MAG: hypothetical protein PHE84_03080 [bacterium]|nr:hypothetical protein [bacterium]